MRFLLTYFDDAHGVVSSEYTEKDLKEWLDEWPHYTKPIEITIRMIS